MSNELHAVNPMYKLERLWKLFLGLFPQPLPRGVSELESFYDNFFSLYDIPALDSYRLALATMMMQAGPTTWLKSPFWFYRSIRAAQAKETAYQVIDSDRKARNLEERQAKQAAYDAKQEAEKAEREAKGRFHEEDKAEVTASSQVAANATNQSQAV